MDRMQPVKKPTTVRDKVLPATRQAVLMEAGYKCGNQTCRHILTLELHHIVWVKDGGGNDSTNLLALCPNCHSLYTARHIPEEAIRHWKGMLVALNHAFGVRSMDLLLFLRATKDKELWYTADGVLQFAGLVAGGLVAITEETVGTPWQITQSSHRLGLTEQGNALVEAWLEGDEKKFESTWKMAVTPTVEHTNPHDLTMEGFPWS